MPLDVSYARRQFPALAREVEGRPAVFFDGPAGSQVPRRVIEAVSGYLANANANRGGPFATSRESDATIEEAHRAVADFLGADDAAEVVFGANMTTLTFALSRSLAREWSPGDEILLTRSEHDANVTPWALAAADAGATVRHVAIRPEDATIDLEDFRAKLSERTKLLALGCASNATGTIHPFAEMAREARAAGAEVFLDAVHFAPHRLLDVAASNCDYLVCSAYKFFGPHVGVLWGRRERLQELTAYKLRPPPEEAPDKWMTGTQNHEGIAGTLAAVEYLADLGRRADPAAGGRREALLTALAAIEEYESGLAAKLLAGLAERSDFRLWGITDPQRIGERTPTFCFTHARLSPEKIASELGRRGVFVWSGNYYALPLTEALGLEPAGAVRVGLLHYNTSEEVHRLLGALDEIRERPPGAPLRCSPD